MLNQFRKLKGWSGSCRHWRYMQRESGASLQRESTTRPRRANWFYSSVLLLPDWPPAEFASPWDEKDTLRRVVLYLLTLTAVNSRVEPIVYEVHLGCSPCNCCRLGAVLRHDRRPGYGSEGQCCSRRAGQAGARAERFCAPGDG